jgi:hypothetical protein
VGCFDGSSILASTSLKPMSKISTDEYPINPPIKDFENLDHLSTKSLRFFIKQESCLRTWPWKAI